MSLKKLLFVSFKPFQIAMTAVSLASRYPREEALHKDRAICPTHNLKWLKIVSLLQLEKLGTSQFGATKKSLDKQRLACC